MNQQRDNNGQHFCLKPLTTSDVEHIAAWYEDINDLALIESRIPVPLNAQSLEKMWHNYLLQTEPRTGHLFSICDEDSEPFGHTGLQAINYANGNGIIFVYIRKDMRRCGLALRAMALTLDIAFYQLRLHRITTYVLANNIPSVSLVKRLGFIDEGCMRDEYFYDGEYGDVNMVGLLAEEWENTRSPLSNALDNNVAIAFGRDKQSRWSWPLN